jgi:hypothetical protein
MEKKEHSPVISLAVAMAGFAVLAVCGIACFSLDRALTIQRHDLSETRRQLLALDQACQTQRHELDETRQQLADATNKFAEAEKQNQTLSRQITEIQSRLRENKAVTETQAPPIHFSEAAPDVPAAESVEGKLRSEGKRWERTKGQPVAGDYGQDIMEGRLDQPKGRGGIGKVIFIGPNDQGSPCAQVDFGRGYVVGIMLSELSKVLLVGADLR